MDGLAIQDNVIPDIAGDEEQLETETRKIRGRLDRKGRVSIGPVEERASPLSSQVSVVPHQGSLRTAWTLLVLFGALTVRGSLAAQQLGSPSLTAILPSQMIAFRVVALIGAKHLVIWEREHDSQVLAATAWGLGPTFSYYLR